MHRPHWTPAHRDDLLGRVTALTAGTAVVCTVGAVALGAGLQAGTSYAASSSKKADAGAATDAAPVQDSPVSLPSTAAEQPARQPSGSAPVANLKPDQIHLVVVNASGTPGVARAAAKVLTHEGFHVDQAAQYAGGALRSSSIVVAGDTAGAVRALTKATGIQQTLTNGQSGEVLLVLGRDWAAATAGTAWAPPQVAPQPVKQHSSSGGGSGGGTTSGGS